MSRRARTRMHHPRRAAVNSVQIAINNARKLPPEDVARQGQIVQQAVDEFCKGEHCAAHWRSLADTANMAETLASMGLGAGADADRVITAAQQTLHDVHQRHATRGTWTLYADEINSLHWLAQLHHVQMAACSYDEFAEAFTTTANRLQQARAGNASPHAIVVVGDLATLEEARPS